MNWALKFKGSFSKFLRLKERRVLFNVISNINWLFVDSALRIVVGTAVSIYVMRYLGPEKYGFLSYAVALSSFFGPLATLSSDSIVVRDMASGSKNVGELLGSSLFIRLGFSSLAVFLSVITSFIIGDNIFSISLVFISSLSFFFQSFYTLGLYYQARLLNKFFVLATGVAFLISSSLRILLIFIGGDVIHFALARTSEFLFGAILLVLMFFILRLGVSEKITVNFSPHVSRYLISESFLLFFTSVFIAFQAQVDQVIIKKLVGERELGLYSASLRIIEFFTLIPVILTQVALPVISQAKGEEETGKIYQDRLIKTYRSVIILSGLFVPFIFLFADTLVSVLLGNKFVGSENILILLSFRFVLTSFGLVRGIFILNEGLLMFYFVSSFLGACLNLFLNLLLVPKFGARGAVFSSLLSFSVTLFIIDLFHPKMRRNIKNIFIALITLYKGI